MYMGPIVRAKTPASPLLRRMVGAHVLVLGIIVMTPFLAIQAVYAGFVLGVRALVRAPHVFLQMIDYAGRVALGR